MTTAALADPSLASNFSAIVGEFAVDPLKGTLAFDATFTASGADNPIPNMLSFDYFVSGTATAGNARLPDWIGNVVCTLVYSPIGAGSTPPTICSLPTQLPPHILNLGGARWSVRLYTPTGTGTLLPTDTRNALIALRSAMNTSGMSLGATLTDYPELRAAYTGLLGIAASTLPGTTNNTTGSLNIAAHTSGTSAYRTLNSGSNGTAAVLRLNQLLFGSTTASYLPAGASVPPRIMESNYASCGLLGQLWYGLTTIPPENTVLYAAAANVSAALSAAWGLLRGLTGIAAGTTLSQAAQIQIPANSANPVISVGDSFGLAISHVGGGYTGGVLFKGSWQVGACAWAVRDADLDL